MNKRYVNIFPVTTKPVYSPYDDIEMSATIPTGMEYVKQSGYILADYRLTLGANPVANAQNVYFDNYAGASCFLDDPTVKIGSLFVENNFNYYSQYNKMVTEVSVHPDELSSQTKHTMELKCSDSSQTREYFRMNRSGVNGDLVGSFCHLLRSGLNRSNRNFNAGDIGGDIEISFRLKDLTKAIYGSDIAGAVIQFYNLRFQYLVQPITQTGLLTMQTTASKRYEVTTGNAYFEYILPVPTKSISSYFSTDQLIKGDPTAVPPIIANPYASVQPDIPELIYTFNNSNNEILTYSLKDKNEMIMNFKRSILKSMERESNSFSMSRLNSTDKSTFGIGLSFEGIKNAGEKIGVNIYSDSSNVNPRLMFTFFHGEITLVQGTEGTTNAPPAQTFSSPLGFGEMLGDSMQTYELQPKYHSQKRSEWIITDQTVLSDMRLVNLTGTNPDGSLLFLTGLAGLVKNIYLYADGKILLSSLQNNNAHRYYAINQLLRSNASNKNVQSILDASFWGFTNVLGANQATVQIRADSMYKQNQACDANSRLELKNFLPILRGMEYLHFKELKLVIDWNTQTANDRGNVVVQNDINEVLTVNPPSLLYERITPDRPLSSAVFWDILVDNIQQDAIPAGPNAVKSTENDILAFNKKTIDSIIIQNDTGPNDFIGNNSAHAMYKEKFAFYDDTVSILPNPADANELQKMMVDMYGSLNIPMLLDKVAVGTGGGGNEGDSLYDDNITDFLHTGSWKCLPLNGRKLKSLNLQYTRTNLDVANNAPAFTQYFIGKVLKAVTFDMNGKAVVAYL